MKIVIDNKIPYIKGAFDSLADVVYLPAIAITADVVKDADALVIRTRTKCDAKLLDGSSVKFIATATIGYDHIDVEYCEQNAIVWTNAVGCNSGSVMQYVASALLVYAEMSGKSLEDLCVGVIGVGNVGSKVAKFCETMGMTVLLNDPPRARVEESGNFVDLSQILAFADVVTLHVPLNLSGDDATYHMCDKVFFESMLKKPLFINSSRGELVATAVLKEAIKSKYLTGLVCDCWENEPDIDTDLLCVSFIATPHIAGYSRDGKAEATKMSVRAVSHFFDFGLDHWTPKEVEEPLCDKISIDAQLLTKEQAVAKAVLYTYDLRKDDEYLRANSSLFEKMREEYPVRREFPAYKIESTTIDESTLELLVKLGFKVD